MEEVLYEIDNSKFIWQLQEAKAMFSEVIKAAAASPQTITVHGREAAVILSISEYNKLAKPTQSLYEFMRESPLYGCDLELPGRPPEKMRKVSL